MSNRIKIAISISEADEVMDLVRDGADEFYCGINHPEYSFALNRREMPHGNVPTLEELQKIVQLAHEHGRPVYATLNKTFYTGPELEILRELIDHLKEFGVDALIVSDIGLMEMLRESANGWRLHLSSVAAPMNSWSVKFFRQYGVERVILPRLHTNEIKNIRAEHPDLEIEVLALAWYCPNYDGICSFQHDLKSFNDAAYERGLMDNACCLEYQIEMINDGDPQRDDFFINSIGKRFSNVYLRMSAACEGCSVFQLSHSGINSLKVVSRLLNRQQKRRCLQFMKKCVDAVESFGKESEFTFFVKKLYKSSFGFDCNNNCYMNPVKARP
ncbi:MAG: peptidase U32 family protein [bacterium]